jgi:serine phosphatase RsbU (regulator of sigma subunit)
MDPVGEPGTSNPESQSLHAITGALADVSSAAIGSLAPVAAGLLGAEECQILIADYSLRSLRSLEVDGSRGDSFEVEGTMAGRCFASGEVVVQGDGPTMMWFPLSDGTERIGVIESRFGGAREPSAYMSDVVDLVVLAIVSRRRYTDVVAYARRSERLTEAAEAQWDLLPPLAHEVPGASVSGAVEPAYDIGGDSFDYAFNPDVLEFAVLDAVGHGLDSVLMAAAAVHSLRNARRSHLTLEETYAQIDARIAKQFGHSCYVTGQLGSLDITNGMLTWINAGHVLPLHVRDRSFIGQLSCTPSRPMGLGGDIRQVAVQQLQPGDRVLFYTDGVTESRAPDGSVFGEALLADFLVRATIDDVPVAETVRRLTARVIEHVGSELRDDATMFLLEYGTHV